MTSLRILGDRETVLAFALGGVPGRVVRTREETHAALADLVRELRAADATAAREPVLLLITRGAAEHARAEVDRLTLDAAGPLVLEIPGFTEPLGENPVQRFVGRVLGVRM